ncbi:MAG TPA: helix-turn-helix domain-containing protein [Usitatibacter sp.]|jgi:AraC family transcriptional regulator, ethanolamine operon transcriptional activator|nr:helix-turn-helix domain-containing protein [Usitatibacter sp.]
MSATATGSTPPAVTVVEITEPTAVNAGIELIDQAAVQLQSMPLRARRVIVRLDAATVVFHSSNLRVRTRTSAHEGLIAYVVFGPRAHGTVNGLPVLPGTMLFAEPGSEAAFVVDAGWESITFLFPPEDIREHLAARQRLDEFRLPHGIEQLHLDPEKVAGLFEWGRRLVDIAARQPGLFNDGVRERAAAHIELLETLLAVVASPEHYEPTRSDRTRQAHSLIVKKAEDYVLMRAGDHVGVSDLCRAAATSERALQNACKDIMGLTPVAYLTRLRLHRVREALVEATHGSTTVSIEALKWGFWHFGDFSRTYKDCFGELPSDTLRMTPARKQPQPAKAKS